MKWIVCLNVNDKSISRWWNMYLKDKVPNSLNNKSAGRVCWLTCMSWSWRCVRAEYICTTIRVLACRCQLRLFFAFEMSSMVTRLMVAFQAIRRSQPQRTAVRLHTNAASPPVPAALLLPTPTHQWQVALLPGCGGSRTQTHRVTRSRPSHIRVDCCRRWCDDASPFAAVLGRSSRVRVTSEQEIRNQLIDFGSQDFEIIVLKKTCL